MTVPRTRLAVALIVLGLLTGCARTTEGSVAMTTEPGPPLTTTTSPTRSPSLPRIPGLPDITIPNLPLPGNESDLPDVPAPPGALTMTCSDYTKLDAATQKAVVNAILEQEGSVLGPDNVGIAKSLADAVCQFLPDSQVSEVLLGGPVP